MKLLVSVTREILEFDRNLITKHVQDSGQHFVYISKIQLIEIRRAPFKQFLWILKNQKKNLK